MNSYSAIVLAIVIPFLFLFTLQNKNIEHFNFISDVKDKVTGWEYRSYPPHSRHYNIKDLLKNIK